MTKDDRDLGGSSAPGRFPPARWVPRLAALALGCSPGPAPDPRFDVDVADPSVRLPTLPEDAPVDTAPAVLMPAPAACDAPIGGWCEQARERDLGRDSVHGRGLLVGDFDNDGWDDVFRCTSGAETGGVERAALLMNRGDGSFYTAKVGLDPARTQDCWGVTAADYDGDRDLDLLVLPGGYLGEHGLVLYRNDFATTGGFTDVTEAVGLDVTPRPWWGGVFGDIDGDGCADLVAVARTGRPALYRNRCNGTFFDEAVDRGVTIDFDEGDPDSIYAEDGKNPVLFDLDRDGDLDLYIAGFNDRNALYLNQAGHFTDVTRTAFPEGVMWTSTPTPGPDAEIFSASVADFDQDGWPDLYFGRQGSQDQVAFNQHDGTFVLYGRELGLDTLPGDGPRTSPENSMGLAVADIDLNGFPDVLVGTGTMTRVDGDVDVVFCNDGPQPGSEAPVHFHRCSDAVVAYQGAQRTHGMVTADFDQDARLEVLYLLGGDPYRDAASGLSSGSRPYLYEDGRVSPPGLVEIALVSKAGARTPPGSRLEVRTPSGSHFALGASTNGFQSTSSAWLMVPTDDAAEVEVEITWPDQTTQVEHLDVGDRRTFFQVSPAPRWPRLPAPPQATAEDDEITAWRRPGLRRSESTCGAERSTRLPRPTP